MLKELLARTQFVFRLVVLVAWAVERRLLQAAQEGSQEEAVEVVLALPVASAVVVVTEL